MDQEYEMAKRVWTEADFEQMQWHDARIYAIAFSPQAFELIFDIDYIFQWVQPELNDNRFMFWVAPATLVFENVYDIKFNIETLGNLEIDSIEREVSPPPRNAQYIGRHSEWKWTIVCQQGEIKLASVGYKQYIRAIPRLDYQQWIDLAARGGYSFAKSFDDTT